jgi:flagellar biosynthetic protein FlhB
MAENSAGEKSLPASEQKILKAREDGNVPKSQDLSAAWTLLIALLGMYFLGPGMFRGLIEMASHYFDEGIHQEITVETFPVLTAAALFRLGHILWPFLLLLVAAGVFINLVQVGVLFSTKAITPKLEKINPLKGFKRFTSMRTFVELIKSLMKVGLVGVIVYFTLRDRWPFLMNLIYLEPIGAAIAVGRVVVDVWWRIVAAMLLLGLIDFGFQKWQHLQELRMTHQEVKEESKQLEGDPKIKQRIRQLQRQMATQRMMQDVPTADVVITNPIRFAIALRYDMTTMQSPIVVAKGARILAKRIRDIATENNVPIIEKPELARNLYRNVEIGQPVPEDVFLAVAEVLAFVYRIDEREEKVRERQGSMTPGLATG